MIFKAQNTFTIAVFLIFLSISISSTYAQNPGCKSFEFNLAQEYQAGGQYANAFISADLNSDGFSDIATPADQVVSVLFGDGVGGYAPPKTFPATIQGIGAIAAGDVNRDGRPDLIAASSGSTFSNNKIAVLLNNGQNGFLPVILNDLPNNVYSFTGLKIGDFNGDGNPDIAGLTQNNFNVFLGNGQGNFSLATTIIWGGNANKMVVGRFNNDAIDDVAVTRSDFSNPWILSVVLGKSSGVFTLDNTYNLTGTASGIETGDFNNDGRNDVIISADYPYQNSTPQTHFLEPWFGDGNGGLSAGAKFQFENVTSGLSKGDFNGDGKADFAVNFNSFVGIVLGRNNGTFLFQDYYLSPGSNSILSPDVNRDGKADLLMLRSGSPVKISVALNTNNDFNLPRPFLYGGSKEIATDLNNDGFLDMVTAYRSDFVSTSNVVTALNDGRNGLIDGPYVESPTALTSIAVGDFNGDGNKDVISSHSNNSRRIAVYLGNGTGNLSLVTQQFIWNRGIENVVAGDFNNDGKDDVFMMDELSTGYVLLSVGDGTFSIVPNFSINSIRYNVTPSVGDFNNDGRNDLALITNSSLALWTGNPNGTFTQNTLQSLDSVSESITKGDFNGDGNLDVASSAFSSAGALLTKFFGNGGGGFSSNLSQTITGQSSSLTSGDFNFDGYDDLAFINSGANVNLVVVPSNAQTSQAQSPMFYSVGGITTVNAADFNNDNKDDLGILIGGGKAIITSTSGQNPCLSINDVTVTEGNETDVTANFTVNLSSAVARDVYFNYTLEAQTATVAADFENTSGRIKIPAGQTSVNIPVTIKGDLLDEFDETFFVRLASSTNASISKSVGAGTIIDNDAVPTLTVTDVSAVEGSFSTAFTFNVALSAPSGKPISFRYATADGTATASSDYFNINNVWNVPAGTASVSLSVTVLGDNTYERDEDFFLNISEPVNVSLADNQGKGTIVNDDSIPTLTAFSGSVVEGDRGTQNVQVTVQLSNPTYLPVTFNILTSDNTAVSGRDYVASNTPITIPAEQQTFTANVQVLGDTINEPTETFFLNLFNASNAVISNPQTQVLIFDDEPVSNDFDRDGKTDVAVFRPSERTWYILYSFSNSFSTLQYGLSDDKIVTGDYNGDSRTDISVWRPSNGVWYSNVPNQTQQWGVSGDIPVHGDYDNDGKTDVAVFRPSNGAWYIKYSSNGSVNILQWGVDGDTPVQADYDGDGKTDIAVYRSQTGSWYIIRSGDGGVTSLQFGISTDKPVAADYDGDGKADIAVFRNGIWYVLRSGDGGVTILQWGTDGDKPVPGNYDGDDKTDFAIYRNGAWWILLSSTNNYTVKQFGSPDDIPIPFVSAN